MFISDIGIRLMINQHLQELEQEARRNQLLKLSRESRRSLSTNKETFLARVGNFLILVGTKLNQHARQVRTAERAASESACRSEMRAVTR